MGNLQKQQGATHAVIIAVIIVLIIVLLGAVFWQHFTYKQNTAATVTEQQTTTSTTKTEPELMTASFNPAFKNDVSFQYPSTWKLTTTLTGPIPVDETGNTATSETLKATSPSAEFSVTYTINSTGGVGGTCEPTESPDKVVQLDDVQVSKFDGAYFAQIIMKDNNSSTYTYDLRLIKAVLLQNLSVGGGVCLNTLPLGGFFSLPQGRMLRASINISALDDSNGTAQATNSLSTITDAFEQPEYMQAKNILLSTSAPADQN